MAFPSFSQSSPYPLPKNIARLSNLEASYPANVCISVWQYLDALITIRNSTKIFNDRTKKALKELFNTNGVLSADELTNSLNETHVIVIQGKHGLGGLGKALYDTLMRNWPNHPLFPRPYTISPNGVKSKNVYLQTFIDITFYPKTNGLIYFSLKSRFRAALTYCFEESAIQSW